MNHAILRRPEVQKITGLSRSHLYLLIQQGTFPPPVKLGARAVGWRHSDVQEWIDGLETASRGGIK
jgi:prophage regulatory protein